MESEGSAFVRLRGVDTFGLEGPLLVTVTKELISDHQCGQRSLLKWKRES